nr:MAG TPA: hypothetical protein [Caudoviricetes sp.]
MFKTLHLHQSIHRRAVVHRIASLDVHLGSSSCSF